MAVLGGIGRAIAACASIKIRTADNRLENGQSVGAGRQGARSIRSGLDPDDTGSGTGFCAEHAAIATMILKKSTRRMKAIPAGWAGSGR